MKNDRVPDKDDLEASVQEATADDAWTFDGVRKANLFAFARTSYEDKVMWLEEMLEFLAEVKRARAAETNK